jgi:hypothetical protein
LEGLVFLRNGSFFLCHLLFAFFRSTPSLEGIIFGHRYNSRHRLTVFSEDEHFACEQGVIERNLVRRLCLFQN